MGCAQSLTEGQRKDRDANARIEAENAHDFGVEQDKIKLLLLGSGESGKSTIFKQMKIMYGKGFSESERRSYLPKIGFNLIEGMLALCEAVIDLKLTDLMAPESKETFDSFLALNRDYIEFKAPTPEMASMLDVLWKDPSIQKAWERRSEIQVNESLAHFMARAHESASPDYVPTVEDVLLCRTRTTGITSEEYLIDDVTFCMYDVGGQRNERKKWIHCFDNVNAIIFVTALSDYDQALWEDESQNRMVESITLFSSICNLDTFRETAMMLFLNKRDMFEDKIKKSAINGQPPFQDYKGKPNDYEDGVTYFREKFLGQNKSPEKRDVFVHVTCATDTAVMRFVFNAAKEIILQENLKNNGFY